MERPRGPVVAAVLGLALFVALAVAASGPWTSHFGFHAVSLWALSATCALGAALTLAGAAVVSVAPVAPHLPGGPTRVGAVGCVVAAVGVALVLVGLHQFPGVSSVAPVTVAIGQFTVGPDRGPGAPSNAAPAVVFEAVVGLVVLTVAGGLLRTRAPGADTSTATRPVVVVSAIGAVALLLGAGALPWSTGDDFTGRSLWRSSPSLAVAAAVLLATAVGTVVLVRRRRPSPSVAVVMATLAGLAGAVVVASRLTFLAADGGSSFSGLVYGRLDGLPSAAALSAAKATVYAGVGLIVLAALAVVSLSALRDGPSNLPDRPLPDA